MRCIAAAPHEVPLFANDKPSFACFDFRMRFRFLLRGFTPYRRPGMMNSHRFKPDLFRQANSHFSPIITRVSPTLIWDYDLDHHYGPLLPTGPRSRRLCIDLNPISASTCIDTNFDFPPIICQVPTTLVSDYVLDPYHELLPLAKLRSRRLCMDLKPTSACTLHCCRVTRSPTFRQQ